MLVLRNWQTGLAHAVWWYVHPASARPALCVTIRQAFLQTIRAHARTHHGPRLLVAVDTLPPSSRCHCILRSQWCWQHIISYLLGEVDMPCRAVLCYPVMSPGCQGSRSDAACLPAHHQGGGGGITGDQGDTGAGAAAVLGGGWRLAIALLSQHGYLQCSVLICNASHKPCHSS